MKPNKLKGARAAKGLTQADVANHLGISSQSYSDREIGKMRFSKEEIIKLCHLLEIDNLCDFNDIFFDGELPIGTIR